MIRCLCAGETRQQTLPAGQRLQRIQIEAHDPGIRQMGERRDQVRNKAGLLPLRLHPDALHILRVARHHLDPNPRDNLHVALQEIRLRLGGTETAFDVTRPVALGGRNGMFPFALLHAVSGARKRRHHPRPLAACVPAAVIEVKVRVNHNVDLFGSEAVLGQFGQQRCGLLDVVNLRELPIELVPNARFDDNIVSARANQQTNQTQSHTVE